MKSAARCLLLIAIQISWSVWASVVLTAGELSPLLAQAEGQGMQVVTTRYFIFDGILVAALVLGALYAICRSSQRS